MKHSHSHSYNVDLLLIWLTIHFLAENDHSKTTLSQSGIFVCFVCGTSSRLTLMV